MDHLDVTIGDFAKHLCRKHDISELELRKARAEADVLIEQDEATQYLATLDDGRTLKIRCFSHQKNHVVSFRPV